MVEPVLTTLGRPLITRSMAVRPIRIQLAPDFFNPRPRSVKGKERMSHDTMLSIFSAKSQDWSCRMRVSVWCFDSSERADGESPRKRPRGPRRTRTSSPPRGVSLLHRGQARHASQFSDRPPPPDIDPPDPPPETTAFQSSDPSIDDPDSPRNVPDPPPPLETDSSPAEDLSRLRAFIRTPSPLDELWRAFEAAEARGYLSQLSSEELLRLAECLADAVESTSQLDDLEELHKWGARVGRVLEAVSPDLVPEQTRRNLDARVLALVGDVQKALDTVHAHRPHYDEFAPLLRVYESILVSTWRHYDRIRALEFLVLEWKSIGSYLLTETSRIHSGTHPIADAGRSLRQTAFAIISALPDPARLLAGKRANWDDVQRQHMGDLLIEAFIRADLPLDSSQVVLEMRRQHLNAAPHLQLYLVRALAREESFAEAHQLYSSITREHNFDHLFTGLYLHAHEGQETEAVDYFNRIADAGWMNPKVIVELMYTYAVQGRTRETLDVFRKYFPEDVNGTPTNRPLLEHFNVGLFAHAQGGDFAGTRFWLELMRKVGHQPDAYVFSTILKTFALRGDLDSITQVLEQMRVAGCNPNRVTYTTVMTLLAHRKDPASAEAIYARAIRDGVVPDTKMIATVMNAHVEAGSWSGVIRAFDFIRTSPHKKLSIGIFNILLKAYVQIGSPFRIVSRVFGQLENLQLRPDEYTFALLIQSACDARLMTVASSIFTEMERLAEHWGSTRHITTWTMTIIMAGFLRLGENQRAMAVYDDMAKRGLKPNAITYGHILSSYGREGTEESFKLAEEFIKNLMTAPSEERSWDIPMYGRLAARSRLYLPLMRSYINQRKPQEVVRLFDEIMQDGGEPTLSLLIVLLESYTSDGDIRSVLSLWPQIFDLGVKYCTVPLLGDDLGEQQTARMHTFILCNPLSMYIRGLSNEGMHDEIARVWKDFQQSGFSFSSDNWNELALALIDAGEVERCFEVLEKVLLPYQRQTNRSRRERPSKPSSPLTFTDAAVTQRPLETPRSAKTRSEATKWQRYHRRAAKELGSEDHADDLAHQLYIVHQISPVWNSWLPRHQVLGSMFQVLLRLRAGYPVDAADAEVTADESNLDPEEVRMRREDAHARLQDILIKYPDAVAEVHRFERKERSRLGRWYTRVYAWAAAVG
ncbi:hypothetical protein C8F01DRAFT_1364888 [Mycena amicta]|nr:hypothetical protein C8F01DRAFT_1364888 [Mycena amicta]